MKLVIIIICLSSFGVIPSNSYAQNTKLSLDIVDTSIKDVLSEIEDNSEFFFLYNNNLVDVERRVSLQVRKRKITEILNLIFNQGEVVFSVVNKQIVLSPKSMSIVVTTTPTVQSMVTGVVTDEFGVTLPGVSIVIKDSPVGVVSEFDGTYSIAAVPEDVLVFSYLGMKPQEIQVGSQTTIDVQMAADVLGLDEIVVVGYGTSKKRDLTGAVASFDVDKLEEIPNVSVIQALQGAVAGLNVGAVNAAGQDPTITVRGQNSLSANAAVNAPLIVVDGIIYRGNLVDLNTSDIETIDILKDASSAAIYGSQASNGVVLVTTKKGKTGKPVINYSASYSIQTPTNTALEPMNATEFKVFLADAYPGQDVQGLLQTQEMKDGYANNFNNNMWDIITGNGYINNHNISVRGKSENFGYFFSGGFTDVKGFVVNDDYRRVNYRINLDAKINDWLRVGTETFLTTGDYSGTAPRSGLASLVHPWTPIYEEDGTPRQILQNTWTNPLLDLQESDDDKRLNLFANIHADVKLPIDGLSYRINFSQNYRTDEHYNFDPTGANFTGVGFKNSQIDYVWSLDNIFTYNKTFKDVHNINATFVYGVEEVNQSFTNVSAQNFANPLLGFNALEAGDPTLNEVDTGKEKETSLYTMGRLQYTFDNKYLLTGTIRRDGFSGFGTNEKIGVFPSISAGWVVSEEKFMEGSSNWLNFLKLRGTYGTTGRRGVGRYDTRAVVNAEPVYIFGDGGVATIGTEITELANNDLGWETTTGINLGVDFALFNSRLRGNMEYYDNSTEDILFAIDLPNVVGIPDTFTNIGEVANHGLEFSFTGQIIQTEDFSWESTVNFSRNRNEVVSVLGADNDGDGIEDDLVSDGLFIGEPTETIYDYEITGIWQQADEDAGLIPNGFSVGSYQIADLDDSGDFSANNDRKILGYTDPSFRMGFANTFRYKKFSLYTFINTVQGGKDFYYGTDALIFGAQNTSNERYINQNVPKGAWDYWTPNNTDARFRTLDGPASFEPNRYLQRNFVRIQDVSLSYSFDKRILDKIGFSNLKVFISGKNLHTFTKWRGWDPETGQGFTWGTDAAQARPVMANYTLGLNVEF